MNTTDSAVRITHIPSKIVVSCQNERSQLQNRATAIAVLQAKLLERRRQEERAKIDALRGDTTAAVLDGEIDEFVQSGIRWRKSLAAS